MQEEKNETAGQILDEVRLMKKMLQKGIFTKEIIPSKDVPAYLGISRRTWQRYRDRRLIPFSQVGRKIWVRSSDLDAFLKQGFINAKSTERW